MRKISKTISRESLNFHKSKLVHFLQQSWEGTSGPCMIEYNHPMTK